MEVARRVCHFHASISFLPLVLTPPLSGSCFALTITTCRIFFRDLVVWQSKLERIRCLHPISSRRVPAVWLDAATSFWNQIIQTAVQRDNIKAVTQHERNFSQQHFRFGAALCVPQSVESSVHLRICLSAPWTQVLSVVQKSPLSFPDRTRRVCMPCPGLRMFQ